MSDLTDDQKALIRLSANALSTTLTQLIADPLIRAQLQPHIDALTAMALEQRGPTPEETAALRTFIDAQHAAIQGS